MSSLNYNTKFNKKIYIKETISCLYPQSHKASEIDRLLLELKYHLDISVYSVLLSNCISILNFNDINLNDSLLESLKIYLKALQSIKFIKNINLDN